MGQGELESLEMTATRAALRLSGSLQTLIMHLFLLQVVQAEREIQWVVAQREGLVLR